VPGPFLRRQSRPRNNTYAGGCLREQVASSEIMKSAQGPKLALKMWPGRAGPVSREPSTPGTPEPLGGAQQRFDSRKRGLQVARPMGGGRPQANYASAGGGPDRSSARIANAPGCTPAAAAGARGVSGV